MTRQRLALYALLLAVGAAAAVLSFSALRDLALLCGFSDRLAWLLPVTVDAGAAASSLVWLGPWASVQARGYGRTLALVLLVGSVGGNALGHGLEAYGARPHWLVVVGVSAIAPAVLGALVHLVVLVGRPEAVVVGGSEEDPTDVDDRDLDSTATDAALIADMRRWESDRGRRPSRDDMLKAYGIGATRARKLRGLIGWGFERVDGPTAADRQPAEVAS